MELKFRNLRENEIAIKVIPVQGGVKLLLYKDARCDQNILDETVGATRWQRHHTRDNANCVVAIYDPDLNQWVEKEDTGTEGDLEKDKALASSSFKRACTNWGIGRELYTSPEMFIPEALLMEPVPKGANITCKDKFSVKKLEYAGENEKEIVSVTIDVSHAGMVHKSIYFSHEGANVVGGEPVLVQNAPTNPAQKSLEPKPVQTPQKQMEAPTAKPSNTNSSANVLIGEDEVILMGNCKGKTYKECKDTEMFKSFLKWAKTASSNYTNPKQKDQFERIKKLAEVV